MQQASVTTILRGISIFEIFSGIAGIVLVLEGLSGAINHIVVPMLLFGVFPVFNIIAGVLLWIYLKRALKISIFLQLAQIPYIYTEGFILNLGGVAALTIKGIWFSQGGSGALTLGVNILALAILIALLKCQTALRVPIASPKVTS